jgi:hypothetical protein
VVILGALAAYMTLERTGAIRTPANVLPSTAANLEEQCWVRYTQQAQVPTGLHEPRALATGPQGALYVAGDREVRVFREGALIAEYPFSGSPHCLTVVPGGAFYVGFRDYVGVFRADGRQVARWEPLGLRAYLTAIASDGTDVWVADAGNRVILHYNRQGQILGRFGDRPQAGGMPALVVPSPYLSLALGADGLLRIANPGEHTINLCTTRGELRGAWGQAGQALEAFAGCCNPTHIALLPDGRIVTAEKGTPRVKVYWPDGRLEALVAGPESFRPEAVGLSLATDAQGRIFVLDPTRRAVRVFVRKEGPKP